MGASAVHANRNVGQLSDLLVVKFCNVVLLQQDPGQEHQYRGDAQQAKSTLRTT